MSMPSSLVVVGFPLRGEWVAVRPPAHRIPSHGTDRFGQRYAFDFVRPDHRQACTSTLAARFVHCCWGRRTRDCYGWGQPVHAAFGGEVVAAADGVPERARVRVLREVALAVKNTVGFDPAQGGVELVAGNHVIALAAAGIPCPVRPLRPNTTLLAVRGRHHDAVGVFAPPIAARAGRPLRLAGPAGDYGDLWTGATLRSGDGDELALPAPDGTAVLVTPPAVAGPDAKAASP